jgi:hypothetical protein
MSILEEEGPSDMLLEKGGVPPHFHRKWMGSGGSITWPPHSADLIPVDVFFWVLSRMCGLKLIQL